MEMERTACCMYVNFVKMVAVMSTRDNRVSQAGLAELTKTLSLFAFRLS